MREHTQHHHEGAGSPCTCGHTHHEQHNRCESQSGHSGTQKTACCCAQNEEGKDAESGEGEPPIAACKAPCEIQKEGAEHEEDAPACDNRDDGCGCGHEHGATEKSEIQSDGIRLGISAVLFAAGLLVSHAMLKSVMLAAAYLVAGFPVLIAAGKNMVSKRVFDETFLMSIATIGAAALGDFAEAAAVMILFGLGELLQNVAVGNSKKSISSLLALKPDTANVLRDGVVVTVDPAQVQLGDLVVVRPFERVPLDGEVVEGESFVDLSALTGESVPVRAHVGKALFSGGINGEGVLTLRVTTPYADSAVNKIIRMTQEAARQKSPREKFITRFARVYTPGVVGLALLVATIPPLMGMGTFQEWIYTALTFLVISCPCALVISVPLAFFAGLGGASRAGVLVRGAAGIEALAKTKAVAFDKTGTLTEGAFQVTGIVPYGAVMREQLLEACALAEQFSTHPIARSILDYYGKAPRPDAVRDVIDVKGRGVSAVVAHKRVLSGNALLLSENGVDIPDQLPGGSVVCVAVDNRYAGYITLGDSPKKEAKQTIATLKSLGIWTVMLTGDNESAAADVASGLGIDDYHAGLLPQDKVTHIERLKDTYSGTTVFVGDGINDAPALATADVGISMGGLGSDAAIEASDVVLMTDEVSKLVSAIRSSRKTLSIVTQNIVLSLGIKGGMMLLGLFGISSMWLAIVADVGAALLAVLNSVRALKIPRR